MICPVCQQTLDKQPPGFFICYKNENSHTTQFINDELWWINSNDLGIDIGKYSSEECQVHNHNPDLDTLDHTLMSIKCSFEDSYKTLIKIKKMITFT